MLYTKSDKIQQYTLGRKGGSNTGNLADNLMEELNCETVFTLPVLGGINESVVVTWIIMAVLVIASIILVRNLKVENPGKVQLALEAGIGAAEDFFVGVLGKENKGYVCLSLLAAAVSQCTVSDYGSVISRLFKHNCTIVWL